MYVYVISPYAYESNYGHFYLYLSQIFLYFFYFYISILSQRFEQVW